MFYNKQKLYFLVLYAVLNNIDRHSGYTYIILYSAEIDRAGVIDVFEKSIRPTLELRVSIETDNNVPFMSAEFLDTMIKNRIRLELCATYHAELDGQTYSKNRQLREMYVAHEFQGTNWQSLAFKVDTLVNCRVSKCREQLLFCTL